MISLFEYSFIQNAFFAGSIIAVVGGIVGYFMVVRGLTFAGHALSHIGFAGAAGALLVGVDPLWGLLLFTIVGGAGIGVFGKDLHEEDLNIGIVMTLALGLGALFIMLYSGYAEEAYSILFGTILGITRTDVMISFAFGIAIIVLLAAIFRPLLFSSIDPEVAEARGVPVKALSVVFLVVIAIAVSMSVQIVGVLLIFTLLVGPAATATRLAHDPARGIVLSIMLGLFYTWLGIFVAAVKDLPISFCIAAISFIVYLPVRMITAHTSI